jgi:hypothetical protein
MATTTASTGQRIYRKLFRIYLQLNYERSTSQRRAPWCFQRWQHFDVCAGDATAAGVRQWDAVAEQRVYPGPASAAAGLSPDDCVQYGRDSKTTKLELREAHLAGPELHLSTPPTTPSCSSISAANFFAANLDGEFRYHGPCFVALRHERLVLHTLSLHTRDSPFV